VNQNRVNQDGASQDSASHDRVEKIAEAVLYEGYMLYPYRASAVKNQQRWNFGVLCPRSYSEEQNGSEAYAMQTQCLLRGGSSARLGVKVRFLQLVSRSVGRAAEGPAQSSYETPPDEELEIEIVDKLEVDGQTFVPWQEAMEREVVVPPLRPASVLFTLSSPFDFPAGRELEPKRDESGRIAGAIMREWQALSGWIDVDSEECQNGVHKITVRIRNLTTYESSVGQRRADALMFSLVSAHTILTVEGGEFVSLLDPPENLQGAAAQCQNIGTWPVMVGEEGDRSTMLSSPIILYDYPQIAPESPGALFDGTEIDEILSLRILTLTDDEKQEVRQSDDRARKMLERTENMPPEQFMKLHGALRGLHPSSRDASGREAR
jgi:hydrogenase maturation protease